MITAGMGILAGLPVLSSGGGTLEKTVKFKIDDTYNRNIITGWNWINIRSATEAIYDTTGAATALRLWWDGGVYAIEDEGGYVYDIDRVFTEDVMQYMLYRGGSNVTIELRGCDPAKRYKVYVAGGQNYNDGGDATKLTISGVTQPLLDNVGDPGPAKANVAAKNIGILATPNSSGIVTLLLEPNGGGYVCFNAIIVEVYSA